MEKIQIPEENPTTYNLFKQELGDDPFKEMEETLKENKQEMDHLRQQFNEMKRYLVFKGTLRFHINVIWMRRIYYIIQDEMFLNCNE